MATSSALDLDAPRGPRAADLPARYRERVLAAFPGQVERIVLFGSRARGAAHDESDWDFAVFLDHEPTEGDKERLSRATSAFGLQVQSLILAGERWLATDELACNIRDQGLIIHGPDQVPMIERPVLEHARDALAKAERFAELAVETARRPLRGRRPRLLLRHVPRRPGGAARRRGQREHQPRAGGRILRADGEAR